MVGVDLYRDASNEATYRQDVRALHRHGKPVVITEFGCCSYVGADDRGGEGFMIIDWSGPEPVLTGNPVRDEQVQADYLAELLDVFEAEDVHGAFVWTFIEPDSPYSPDPRRDLDMAGFAIVRCEADYAATGRVDAEGRLRHRRPPLPLKRRRLVLRLPAGSGRKTKDRTGCRGDSVAIGNIGGPPCRSNPTPPAARPPRPPTTSRGWDIGAVATLDWAPWGSRGDARAKVLASGDGYFLALVEADAGLPR